MVALHEALVDAEVVEVDKQAKEQDDPEGGLREVRRETAEAEFIRTGRNVQCLTRTVRVIHNQQHGNHHRANKQHEALDDIRPDHRLDAAKQRVECHGQSRANNDYRQAPTGEGV